jgi:hypothetical protein
VATSITPFTIGALVFSNGNLAQISVDSGRVEIIFPPTKEILLREFEAVITELLRSVGRDLMG